MKKRIQQVTVKGILENQHGKVLLVKDRRGKWELPGGRIIFGENPSDALQREFQEELGINRVQPGNIIHCWAFESSTDVVDYHFIVLVYACIATSNSQIEISSEHLDSAWLSPGEINEFSMRDEYKETLRKYLDMNGV